jgi:hypothetical protein
MSTSNHDSQSNVVSIVAKLKVNPQPDKKSSHSQGLRSGTIIKSTDLNSTNSVTHSPSAQPSPVQVKSYMPPEMLGKRFARPESILPPVKRSSLALEALRDNFNSLNDLQARLRFMLNELEELVKK